MNYFLFIHKFAIAPFFYLKLIFICFPQNAIPIYVISFIPFCFNDTSYFLSSICFKALERARKRIEKEDKERAEALKLAEEQARAQAAQTAQE